MGTPYPLRFVTETDKPPPWDDCAVDAGRMWAWANYGRWLSRADIRLAAGVADKPGTSEGLTPAQLRAGLSGALGVPVPIERPTWPELVSRLQEGATAVLSGYYSRLRGVHGLTGQDLTRWDPLFAAKPEAKTGHAVHVSAYNPGGQLRSEWLWLQDPLARGTAWLGEWAPETALRTFTWQSDGRYEALMGPVPKEVTMACSFEAGGLRLASSYVVEVPAGTVVYDAHQKQRCKLTAAATCDYLGLPSDRTPYYAVLIETAAGYADGKSRPTVVLVRRGDVPLPRVKTTAELAQAAALFGTPEKTADVKAVREALDTALVALSRAREAIA